MTGNYSEVYGNKVTQPLETNCNEIEPDSIDQSICSSQLRSLPCADHRVDGINSGEYLITIVLIYWLQ